MGVNLWGGGLVTRKCPNNRNSPGTLQEPFAGLQSWANLQKCIFFFVSTEYRLAHFSRSQPGYWPGLSRQGQYEKDMKNGEGVFIWPDGRSYRGHWSGTQ